MNVSGFVLQLDPHFGARSGQPFALVLEEQRLGAFEAEVDRIDRDDAGEDGLVGDDAVADVHQPLGHTAGNRRPHGGEADLELLSFDTGACRIHFGHTGAHGGAALLDFFLTGGLRFGERLGAGKLGPGVGKKGFGPGELCPCLFERGTRGAGVDREQNLPGADELPVGEVHLLQVTGRPRTNFDVLNGFEPADVVVPVTHLLHQRLRDGHGRNRGGSVLSVARAGGDSEGGSQRQKPRFHLPGIGQRPPSIAAVQRQQLMTGGYSRVHAMSTPVDLSSPPTREEFSRELLSWHPTHLRPARAALPKRPSKRCWRPRAAALCSRATRMSACATSPATSASMSRWSAAISATRKSYSRKCW